MKVQNYASVTRKQLLTHTPTLRQTFETYHGDTAGELLTNIDKAPTSTPVTTTAKLGGYAAIAGGLLATGMAVANANLAMAAPGGIAIALGALAAWGGHQMENTLHNRSVDLQNNVKNEATATAQTLLLTTQDGKITDHAFYDNGAFTNPVEVREEGTGKVLSREVTVNGFTLKEDAQKQEVSLNDTTFPGYLELPTAERKFASLVHETAAASPEPLQDTRIAFDQEGHSRIGATGKWYWDDIGFSYLTQATVHELNEDGTAYLNGHGWFGLRPPAGLVDNLPATGRSDRVTVAGPNSQKLQLSYGVTHGDINGVELVPLRLSERPVAARLVDTRVEAKDGQVDVRRGQETRHYEGSLDNRGNLTIQTAAGEVTQDLGSQLVSLTLKTGAHEFSFMQSDEKVSVYQNTDYTRTPEASVTPEGNFELTWDGGTTTVEVPVPLAWM